jgi:hypothetical protein
MISNIDNYKFGGFKHTKGHVFLGQKKRKFNSEHKSFHNIINHGNMCGIQSPYRERNIVPQILAYIINHHGQYGRCSQANAHNPLK